MAYANPIKVANWVFGVVGKEKSFRSNPILGSERLNQRGLHRTRVAAAARMAVFRRKLIGGIDAADRAAYARDGFVMRENYLPQDLFESIRAELLSRPHPAWELREGHTVTRMIPLTTRMREQLPLAVQAVRDPYLEKLTGYVAGRTGAPIHFVQIVLAEPKEGPADPQTMMHADTFHSTTKFWLFLHDVGEDDGPFMFVPGSHRLTPERLEWEYHNSIAAQKLQLDHHSDGSFRVAADELGSLGYGPPRRMVVKANTLIVADTYGFHSRSPSDRPTVRMELHGHLRRNPFTPWNGLDYQSLPGVKGRQLDIHLDRLGKRQDAGHKVYWTRVGSIAADAPPQI